MRRAALILPLLMLACLFWWVLSGSDMRLAEWAAGWQRQFQNELAATLRALRAREPGALALLLGVCFGYGFFHAVGPGHGKVLIGGYGLGRAVPFLRLSVISTLAALGQAAAAILLMLFGMLVLDLSRAQLTDTAERMMLPASTIAIGLVGLWLAWRGILGLRQARAAGAHHHDHDHHHDGHGDCGCGHRHGPSPEELRQAGNPRETLALIFSIAIRPCSGAILLLVLTWHMGILAAGMLGVVAMSLGTAVLTIIVAAISVFARETTVLSVADNPAVRLILPAFQLLAGLAIAFLSLRVLGAI